MTYEISKHQFNQANDAFYDTVASPDLNEQGERRVKLEAAFKAAGVVVRSESEDKNNANVRG